MLPENDVQGALKDARTRLSCNVAKKIVVSPGPGILGTQVWPWNEQEQQRKCPKVPNVFFANLMTCRPIPVPSVSV